MRTKTKRLTKCFATSISRFFLLKSGGKGEEGKGRGGGGGRGAVEKAIAERSGDRVTFSTKGYNSFYASHINELKKVRVIYLVRGDKFFFSPKRNKETKLGKKKARKTIHKSILLK